MAQTDPKLNFTGLNSALAARWQAGVPDANGHPPERHVSEEGTGPRSRPSAVSQTATLCRGGTDFPLRRALRAL